MPKIKTYTTRPFSEISGKEYLISTDNIEDKNYKFNIKELLYSDWVDYWV